MAYSSGYLYYVATSVSNMAGGLSGPNSIYKSSNVWQLINFIFNFVLNRLTELDEIISRLAECIFILFTD